MEIEIVHPVQGCVIDTNILIYHLHDALTEKAEKTLQLAFEAGSSISVITRIELLGWQKHTEKSLKRTEALLGLLDEEPLTSDIVDICVGLRKHQAIKIPDAIIAATALQLKKPLMTKNMADFRRIDQLFILDLLKI